MHIALDASRTTVVHRTGTENYALQLLRRLVELDTEHQFHLYFRDMPPETLFPVKTNIHQHSIPWPRMWTHLRFAATLWRTRPAVTFVPAHTLPRLFPGKAVVTVHDLGYLPFPEAHPEDERKYLDWTTRFSANRATLILADSEATRGDLIKYYAINPQKIRVVYPGTDESLTEVSDHTQIAAVKAKYQIDGDYFFFLGTLQPRKNIARLVQAYAQWRIQHPEQNIRLVLAGKAGWLYDEAWTAGVEGVVLTGYIADEDVSALYSGAMAFLFPSLYEGFGFPVLEAMRCGAPVLCSNTSSLPELAGDAAILVDPEDIESIATGIARLADDANLRAELVEKGFQQVAQFTWQQAAEQTLQVLEQAANG